ncbi:MAG TPA: DUF3078 domain-containing protein [Bacteroidales bacterium]|nr:DUF3078 domain-containing protein [Bacteroidales bacterium]MDD4394900.1 DUF3078 domain-containing protein [Bacteroidales bacterium]HNW67803.1 DUF3078 domain-containing protein [Bacteroidales bacterium]HPT51755.1 DUF3078 domain-containing protein [Bacteroidales bacterium]
MMKKWMGILMIMSLIFPLFGQTNVDTTKSEKNKYWKFTGLVSLNFSETMQWNWAAGGNNNGNGILAANVKLVYKKDKIAWETTFDSDYGWMWAPSTNFKWRKSHDKIVFSSKFGWEFHKSWYLTVMANFKSHYSKGYEYTLDANKVEQETYAYNWLSPSYSDLSIGVDWKPNEIFTVYLSPVAGRITTAADSLLRKKYGVELDKSIKTELGATFKAGVNFARIKNFKVISVLTLFTPYNKHFGKIDVDWDLAVSYQFLKVLNVTLGTSLKYYDAVSIMWTDKDEVVHNSPRVQFREIIGLGIGYSF